ncbi:hypothetical protein ABK040_016780 [Willaertia magna]
MSISSSKSFSFKNSSPTFLDTSWKKINYKEIVNKEKKQTKDYTFKDDNFYDDFESDNISDTSSTISFREPYQIIIYLKSQMEEFNNLTGSDKESKPLTTVNPHAIEFDSAINSNRSSPRSINNFLSPRVNDIKSFDNFEIEDEDFTKNLISSSIDRRVIDSLKSMSRDFIHAKIKKRRNEQLKRRLVKEKLKEIEKLSKKEKLNSSFSNLMKRVTPTIPLTIENYNLKVDIHPKLKRKAKSMRDKTTKTTLASSTDSTHSFTLTIPDIRIAHEEGRIRKVFEFEESLSDIEPCKSFSNKHIRRNSLSGPLNAEPIYNLYGHTFPSWSSNNSSFKSDRRLSLGTNIFITTVEDEYGNKSSKKSSDDLYKDFATSEAAKTPTYLHTPTLDMRENFSLLSTEIEKLKTHNPNQSKSRKEEIKKATKKSQKSIVFINNSPVKLNPSYLQLSQIPPLLPVQQEHVNQPVNRETPSPNTSKINTSRSAFKSTKSARIIKHSRDSKIESDKKLNNLPPAIEALRTNGKKLIDTFGKEQLFGSDFLETFRMKNVNERMGNTQPIIKEQKRPQSANPYLKQRPPLTNSLSISHISSLANPPSKQRNINANNLSRRNSISYSAFNSTVKSLPLRPSSAHFMGKKNFV